MKTPANIQNVSEKTFNGELIVSDQKKPISTTASAKIKSNKISISFILDGELIAFTAVKNEQDQFMVSEKVMDDFILTGISHREGKKKMTHVELARDTNTLCFHVIIDFFTGESKEVYFYGTHGKVSKWSKLKRSNVLRTVAALV